MNYLRIYNQIIEKRKIEKPVGYKERHHIIPRCLNGSNEESNLIDLTAREHYICHLLLVKAYKNTNNYYKLLNAFLMMNCKNNKQSRYYNSKLYEYLRTEFSNLMHYISSGNNNSNYEKIWLNNKRLQISKSVKKEDVSKYLLDGWEIGRIIDWESYNKKINDKIFKLLKKKEDFNNKIKLYTNYYKIYDKFGWEKFKEVTKFDKSKPYLVMSFKKYVKEFVPQNGKKRGKVI